MCVWLGFGVYFPLIGPVCGVNPIQGFMETDQAEGLCVVLVGSL